MDTPYLTREFMLFNAHHEAISGLTWLKSGKFFYSGSIDNTVKLWEIDSSHSIHLNTVLRKVGPRQSSVTRLELCGQGSLFVGNELGNIERFPPVNMDSELQEHCQVLHVSCGGRSRQRYQSLTLLKSLHVCDDPSNPWANGMLASKRGELLYINTAAENFATDDSIQWREPLLDYDWVTCALPLPRDFSHPTMEILIAQGNGLWTIELASPGSNSSSHIVSRRLLWQHDEHSTPVDAFPTSVSHLERLHQTDEALVCAACSDSSIRVFDVESHRLVTTMCHPPAEIKYAPHYPHHYPRKRAGHAQADTRIWETLEIEPQLLASVAADGYVALWDLRCGTVVHRSARHEGGVTGLLWSSEMQSLITASCADNPSKSRTKGTLSVYDLRRYDWSVSTLTVSTEG